MFATQDYVLNGQAFGPVAEAMAAVNWDNGYRRPYLDKNGRLAVTINTGRTTLVKGEQVRLREHRLVRDLVNAGKMEAPPVTNATALRKEEWIELDKVVLRPARYRLQAWADLASRNTYGGFNAMGKMILERETMSDPGEAMVDMDGLTPGRNDAPVFQLEGTPLPITHADFWFSSRKLAISRNGGSPLDTVMGEAAGRRIAETIEKTLIGTNTGITYGGNSTQVGGYSRTPSVYGYTNFPQRLTYTSITTPTGSNASATLSNVLAMLDLLKANKFYGPFMLYTSNDWDRYMDNDYILTGGNVATQTLRQRLKMIGDIIDVKRLDMLFSANVSASTGPGGEGFTAVSTSPFTLILVQMTPDVARAVNGMDITTIQWETQGGLKLQFKAMCIQVPQLGATYYGGCGICVGTTA